MPWSLISRSLTQYHITTCMIVKREKTTTVHGPDHKMRGYSGYIWNHTRGLVEEKLTTAEESSESVESLALYSKDLKGV